MRYVFECLECGVHYLPPEGMSYPDGPASPVWCTVCQGLMCQRGIPEPAAAAAVALAAAKAALTARTLQADEATPDVRPSRPARTRRARSGPSSARSKLG
ncbi:hypothetical protein J2S46_000170 [Kitasatospora herbaricolor]|uniref:hypothetical protein n=1 Tax=Kitasatospora herbaricolor TaxID=68217 RepID=UPI00174D5CF7|nr:hypothetical protein [Kitasatospora herbaricolor]MDQ0305614.1 hypothetical protein [Kitasatospora herbaricolor]